MTKHSKLWLDDYRSPPSLGWVRANDFNEVTAFMLEQEWDHISLDHDLEMAYPSGMFGSYSYYDIEKSDWYKSGHDVTKWMVENDVWPRRTLGLHTDYSTGRANMAKLIEEHGPFTHKVWYRRDGNYPTFGWVYYNASKE